MTERDAIVEHIRWTSEGVMNGTCAPVSLEQMANEIEAGAHLAPTKHETSDAIELNEHGVPRATRDIADGESILITLEVYAAIRKQGHPDYAWTFWGNVDRAQLDALNREPPS